MCEGNKHTEYTQADQTGNHSSIGEGKKAKKNFNGTSHMYYSNV